MITWIIIGVFIYVGTTLMMYEGVGYFDYIMSIPILNTVILIWAMTYSLNISIKNRRIERIRLENDFETSNFEKWEE